jgi:hypothetical protein
VFEIGLVWLQYMHLPNSSRSPVPLVRGKNNNDKTMMKYECKENKATFIYCELASSFVRLFGTL